jgi:hypothetical protein
MPCHDYVRAWERDRLTFVPDQKKITSSRITRRQQRSKNNWELREERKIGTQREGTAYI